MTAGVSSSYFISLGTGRGVMLGGEQTLSQALSSLAAPWGHYSPQSSQLLYFFKHSDGKCEEHRATLRRP